MRTFSTGPAVTTPLITKPAAICGTLDTATGKATQVNTTYAGESETANPAVSGSITYSRLNGLYIVPAQKPLGATDQAVSIT